VFYHIYFTCNLMNSCSFVASSTMSFVRKLYCVRADKQYITKYNSKKREVR